MRLFRPTLRIRLALLYGGLVLLVGLSLLVAAVVLLNRSVADIGVFRDSRGTVTIRDSTREIYSGSPEDLIKQAHDQASSYLLHTGLIYFAIIVAIGSLGGYLLAKQALRPIARVTHTAQQLSTETLSQRIDLGGPDDELRELADTFDEMLGRLDAAFDSQRLFVANASHELWTPLSVIRTELDVTLSDPDASVEELRRMGQVVAQATERAQRLVGSLLTLARLQAGVAGELETREQIDLRGLVPAVLAAVEAEAQDRQIAIEHDLAEACTLGDPRLLERLIGNLVENAVRHNVAGGWLRITSGETAELAWLHVANGGAVIAQSEVVSLFDPFRRGGGKVRTANRGSGLGLSIVRLIVEAHHGRLQAAAPPFGGLAIRIELPGRSAVPATPAQIRQSVSS
ncbi:MAG: HAMP domain-containing sensor histidine kinase [Actinomycetota bacterium]